MRCFIRRRRWSSPRRREGGLSVLLVFFTIWCCTTTTLNYDNHRHDNNNNNSSNVVQGASFSYCGSFQRTRLKNNSKANNFINNAPPVLSSSVVSPSRVIIMMVKVPKDHGSNHAETTFLTEDEATIDDNDDDNDKRRTSGLLVLLTVPMAWGTFEPAVRYVYSVDVHPKIPAMVFSLSYYLVASVALLLANAVAASSASIVGSTENKKQNSSSDSDAAASTIVQVEEREEEEAEKVTRTAMHFEQQVQKDDDGDDLTKWPIRGGLELGGYLFLGNALQVIGLQTVAADRAAFLLQLTTIFVPLLQALLEGNLFAINGTVWLACLVALTGVAIMGLDNNHSSNDNVAISSTTSIPNLVDTTTATQPSSSSMLSDFEPLSSLLHNGFSFSASSSLQEAGSSSLSLSSGDVLVVAAAVAYSFHCIRLEGFAKRTSAVKLAATKAMTETLLSALVLVGLVLYASSSQQSPILPDETAELIPTSYDNVFTDFCQTSGTDIISFFKAVPAMFVASSSSSNNNNNNLFLVALATIWTGVVTVAYTIYAQSYGQSRVSPVLANLIYTSQPIYTAILAWILLGESLGVAGYLGGALIGSAVLLVVAVPSKPAHKK